MSKLVVLNIVDGDFENGFPIFLEIATEGEYRFAEANGKLPPAPELLKHYQNWQLPYSSLVSGLRSSRIHVAGSTTSIPQIKAASQNLKSSLNDWLNSPQMRSISRTLYQNLNDKSEEIRVIIRTQNSELQRLPWHLWDDFFQHYLRSEVVLSLPVRRQKKIISREKARILAVFGKREAIGNTTEIKLNRDLELLEQHLSKDTHFTPLREPTLEELYEEIERRPPDLFFFAGHSSSEENGTKGLIELNQEQTITIDDLKPALREAVEEGLQLAIFNSCDGLGIARELADLGIPQIIVMREPVPDVVAQKFLQRFLEAFVEERSVSLAVRRAREKIHHLEVKYPGVTWLPVVFQNPAEPSLTGREFRRIATGVEPTQANPTTEASQPENQSQILCLPSVISSSATPSGSIANPPPRQQPSPNQDFSHICSQGHENSITNRFCIRCGEALEALSTVLPISNVPPPAQELLSTEEVNQSHAIAPVGLGSLLKGRYRIIKLLGQGGFGQTYLAEDIDRLSTICVVKQLKLSSKEPNLYKIARRLFDTEAKVLEILGRHNQIPQLLAYFEENQEFYLIQEFIDGQDLSREIILGKQMSESCVLFLLRDVLQILEFVHQRGVIHRDIKPSNLIRRKQDGKLVLIDFGAVKQISNQTFSTQEHTGSISIGTPGYVPPEQMAGRPQYSSDIYALGILCIQALTGVPHHQLSHHPSTDEISWRGQATVSPQLARILDKMVRYDFRQRYQSATEVLQDLQRSRTQIPTPPALPDPRSKITSLYRRRIWTLVAAFIAVIALAGLTFIIFAPK